jgi:D-arginine dehydrogenase
MSDFDIAIVGAGIAGASIAAEIGAAKSVLLLEAEDAPGYHSTGRSAAFWSETYGGPLIQPLTSASYAFLSNPPLVFANTPLLRDRGALHLGTANDEPAAANMLNEFAKSGVALDRLTRNRVEDYVQGLRSGWDVALWEPDCCDIDVAALHAGYLKQARMAGVRLQCRAPLHVAAYQGGQWQLSTGAGDYTSKILVNAAGAWADNVALISGQKAIEVKPYKRTIMQLAVEPLASPDLPLVVGLDGSFYFKPESGGKVWLSPHDEIASEPCDAAPDELDIAMAIDRFQQVVDWAVVRVERKWAGLRSFAPDRLPVIGRDPYCPDFFWLAGQGGFGIQTAPAVAKLAAALLLEQDLAIPGIAAPSYGPDRLR